MAHAIRITIPGKDYEYVNVASLKEVVDHAVTLGYDAVQATELIKPLQMKRLVIYDFVESNEAYNPDQLKIMLSFFSLYEGMVLFTLT
jgi:hypothetical protein